MYDEPARPSPMPAPMAPPARARPPPTKAPASVMACSVFLTAMSLLEFHVDPSTPWLYSWVRSSGCSGRRYGLLLVRLALLVRRVRDRRRLVLLVVVVPSAGHGEVEHGQQGEDEGLEAAD